MSKPNPANVATAARIAQARQAAGSNSAHAAAIRLAMHPQTYGYHERGVRGVRAADLRRYAEAFGVSRGWLTSEIGAGPKEVSNPRPSPLLNDVG